ncbi:MAG: YibE/F family protein [Oscillospiraceae bacterium]|jgi:uncharacterized membrane protein|nr:YibE/F family protein [Oscillospiraceae bacterium]
MKKAAQELTKEKSAFLRFWKSRRFWIVVFGLVFCTFVILNSGFLSAKRDSNFTTQRARVLSVDNSNLLPDPEYQNMILGTQILEIKFLTGELKGQVFKNIENKLQPLFSNMAVKDMVMLFNIRSQEGEVVKIDMFGYSRDGLVYALIGLFIALLIIVGKKKGLYSMIGLGFTIISIIFFLLPAILHGQSPILMAIITSIITSVFTIFLISDISMKGLASILGILAGVASAGIIGITAGNIGHVSGLNLSDAEGVLFLASKLPLKIPELLSAGIIIAALGAVIDVSMSIASAIFEVKRLNPDIDVRKLYKSGMNIGGDIMAATANTLIMAFVGSSFCILIILALYQLPYMCLINLNLFIVELIQGIASSIGLVLTVPVTAICAASLASRNKLTTLRSTK